MIKVGESIPEVDFYFREDSEFVVHKTSELFNNKRVVIFGLPGAFTPTCSSLQLPEFESFHDMFRDRGIDEIYCISVNDAFVMNAWAKDQFITKTKMIPDGNGEFTNALGMLVNKSNFGFGFRSWRYAAVIDNGVVEKLFVEDGIGDNIKDDPFEISTAEKVLEYVKEKYKELI